MIDDKVIRIATDVGGTFTDLVYFELDRKTGQQVVRTAKADTTPPNFEQGVLDVLAKGGVKIEDIDFMAHGTTVVINALTERKGAKVGLITTKGFRDVLEIARGDRPDFFNLQYSKPEPFVPRYLRREVAGRISFNGDERERIDLSELKAIVADFKSEGVQAIAICLLHSYTNPGHEKEILAEIERLWPDIPVVASHQITREWREYERTNTAALSAYVQPIAERYLTRLTEGLSKASFNGSLYIMRSNCGVDKVDAIRRIPITMVESGPASGFWGAAELGRLIGQPNVLALDIGGTTAKCSLIENGQVKIISDYWIERSRRSAGFPIMVPVVDLVEIGNGGGSVAWVDQFRKLHVGPQSAGASPGPAAYGRGGDKVTTTDANLALGRINPDFFRGGAIKADMHAVETALDRLASELGVDRVEAARGVVRIANNNMINALKLVSLNRGHDPRDFTMIAFGGGGAMHAAALAAELGVKHIVVPTGAGVFSAWGMMMSDLRRDFFVTRLLDTSLIGMISLSEMCRAVEEEALSAFANEQVAPDQVRFQRFAKMRYQNQEHAVEVPVPDEEITDTQRAEIVESFHCLYEREYSYRLSAPVEVIGAHIVATAEVGKLEPTKKAISGRSVEEAIKGRRNVDYADDGRHETLIYDGNLLEPDMAFEGPAIIEDSGTTTVVHPNQSVTIDAYGNIHIKIG